MDKRVAAFLKVLDTDDTTTGGGTASAVAGAMAAGLAAMVSTLSLGKPGMEPEQFYLQRKKVLDDLSQELFTGGWQDTAAFAAVQEAYRLPKASPQEKDVRRRAVQAAWVEATEVPLANAEKCLRVLTLATELEGHSNENAASDLRCAQYLAYVGALGCLENVEINVPMIKDEYTAKALAERAQSIWTAAAEHRPRRSDFL